MRSPRIAVAGLCLALFAGLSSDAGPIPGARPLHYPEWWFTRDVIPLSPDASSPYAWPDDYPLADDFAVANIGQLKQIARLAYDELVALSPPEAWTTSSGLALRALIKDWYLDENLLEPKATGADNFAALNQGQLKTVARLFYNRLYEAGYVLGGGRVYPWSEIRSDDDSYSTVNLGQLKQAFSFDLKTGFQPTPTLAYVDSDNDGMRDEDEITFFGNLDQGVADDDDGDGITNLQELNIGWDPSVANALLAPLLTTTIPSKKRFCPIPVTNPNPIGELRYAYGNQPTGSSTLLPNGQPIILELFKLNQTPFQPFEATVIDLRVGLFLPGKNEPVHISTFSFTPIAKINRPETSQEQNANVLVNSAKPVQIYKYKVKDTYIDDWSPINLPQTFENVFYDKNSALTSPRSYYNTHLSTGSSFYRFAGSYWPNPKPATINMGEGWLIKYDYIKMYFYGYTLPSQIHLLGFEPQNGGTDYNNSPFGIGLFSKINNYDYSNFFNSDVMFWKHSATADYDQDFLIDSFELIISKTDPYDKQTEGNLADVYKAYGIDGTKPTLPPGDADGDGLSDILEATLGTLSNNADSDGDGISDAFEYSLIDGKPLVARQEVISSAFQAALIAGWQDTDGDWLPNSYDAQPSAADGEADPDGDGLNNRKEWSIGTNQALIDTDNDRMPDGWEYTNILDPRVPATLASDSDLDGLPDYLEYEFDANPHRHDGETTTPHPMVTNPYTGSSGTFGDGLLDLDEVLLGLQPLVFDSHYTSLSGSGLTAWADHKDDGVNSDADSLTNLSETALGTNATLIDSDTDGLPDDYEQYFGLTPRAKELGGDKDKDGLTNFEEYQRGLLPNDYDSDGDGLGDKWETDYLIDSDPATFRPGLLAWWRFDTNLAEKTTPDSASARHPARLHGAAILVSNSTNPPPAISPATTPFEVRRIGDQVLSLDGKNAYVTIPNHKLPDLAENFTFAFWFKPSSTSFAQARQLLDRRGAYTLEVIPNGASNRLSFTVYIDGQIHVFLSAAALQGDAWNHIAVAVDRNNGRLYFYLNGILDSSVHADPSLGDPFDSTNWPLVVGSQRSLPSRTPLGLLDDLRLYDKVVAAADLYLLADPKYDREHTIHPELDPNRDRDEDGLTDRKEYELRTNPEDSDTDDDNLLDGAEYHTHNTSPHLKDTDGDFLTDGQEILGFVVGGTTYYTLAAGPGSQDSDADGVPDYSEFYSDLPSRTEPPVFTARPIPFSSARTSTYGLTDLRNGQARFDGWDTDRDGMPDGWELANGLNPVSQGTPDWSLDPDGDLLNNRDEYRYQKNPHVRDNDNLLGDTDNDGLSNGQELYVYCSNPNLKFTLGGGMDDLTAARMGLLPQTGSPCWPGPTQPDLPGSGNYEVALLPIPITPRSATGPIILPRQEVALSYSPGDQVFISEEAFTNNFQVITAFNQLYLIPLTQSGQSVALPKDLQLKVANNPKTNPGPYSMIGQPAANGYHYGPGYDITDYAATMPRGTDGKIRFLLQTTSQNPPVVNPGDNDGGPASCIGSFNCPPDPINTDPDNPGCPNCPPVLPPEGTGTGSGDGWDSGVTTDYEQPDNRPQPPTTPSGPGQPPAQSGSTYAATRLLVYVDNKLNLDISHASLPDTYLRTPAEDTTGATLSYARDSAGTLVYPPPAKRSKLRMGKGPDNTASRTLTWNNDKLLVLNSSDQVQQPPLTQNHNNIVEFTVVARPGATGAELITAFGHNANGTLLTAGDTVRVLAVDLDIDSDNNNTGPLPGDRLPSRSQVEEDLESTAASAPDAGTASGKLVVANTGDIDLDGVPNYADGLDNTCVGIDTLNGDSPSFAPMVLEINPDLQAIDTTLDLALPTTWEKVKLKFIYDAANPSCVNRTVDGYGEFGALPDEYSPGAGSFRIWTKDGGETRKVATVNLGSANGGDYVPDRTELTLRQLGFSATTRTITLYIEGIKPTANRGASLVIKAASADRFGTFSDYKEVAKIEFTIIEPLNQ